LFFSITHDGTIGKKQNKDKDSKSDNIIPRDYLISSGKGKGNDDSRGEGETRKKRKVRKMEVYMLTMRSVGQREDHGEDVNIFQGFW
jgi:hypothetical protein